MTLFKSKNSLRYRIAAFPLGLQKIERKSFQNRLYIN